MSRSDAAFGAPPDAACLDEVGCTEDQVGAIVGMSPAMVRHYAKEVSKFRLARSAMELLEYRLGSAAAVRRADRPAANAPPRAPRGRGMDKDRIASP